MSNSIPSDRNDAENSSKVKAIPSAHYIRNTVLVAGSFVALILFLSSCTEGLDKYDNKIVKDAHGEIFKIKHELGRLYYIEEINSKELDSLKIK
jgi:hypothetical protein